MSDYKYESGYERDPKTGMFVAKRKNAWRQAQGKDTGDYTGFSDYGAKTSAEETRKEVEASGHGGKGLPGGRTSYGVDYGD